MIDDAKRIFKNAEGRVAIRLADLVLVRCTQQGCGIRFFVESPVHANVCTKCEKWGLERVEWGDPEPFWVQEGPSGKIEPMLPITTANDEPTNPGIQTVRESGKE